MRRLHGSRELGKSHTTELSSLPLSPRVLALLSVCTRICVTLLLIVAFPVTGNQTQEDFVNRFTEQTVKSEPFLFQHKHSIILNIRAISYD